MTKAQKNSIKLETLRWFWFIPSGIIYLAARSAFGIVEGTLLAVIFGAAFFVICSRGRMRVISEEIVADITRALAELGQRESFFEVKKISPGFIVRVYLVRARKKAPLCNKAIIESLEHGWYSRHVTGAQIVDIDGEEDMKQVQRELNIELVDELREKLDKNRKRKK